MSGNDDGTGTGSGQPAEKNGTPRPQPGTVEALVAEVRQQVDEERARLAAIAAGRPLTLPVDDGCPAELRDRIERHNQAVVEVLARLDNVGHARVAFVATVLNDDLKISQLTKRAADLRAERLDALRRYLELHKARGALLAACESGLSAKASEAAEAYERIRNEKRDTLVAAGADPKLTTTNRQNALAIMVDYSPESVAARKLVEQLQARAMEYRDAIQRNLELQRRLVAELLKVWRDSVVF